MADQMAVELHPGWTAFISTPTPSASGQPMEVPYKMLKFLNSLVDPSFTEGGLDTRTKELGAMRSDFRTRFQRKLGKTGILWLNQELIRAKAKPRKHSPTYGSYEGAIFSNYYNKLDEQLLLDARDLSREEFDFYIQ
uniref:Uncharacterized protein n=1 Tax=Nelumbo nucifera TaxID=4432 RepID=A0A822ZYY3_NELNU|nr:TPA_asm: hypothetical protein HUJ06_018668 [Nelumbo nucifera]